MLDVDLFPSELKDEYFRWVERLGDEDPYAEPDTLSVRDVLDAHFLIADFFLAQGQGLGGVGPRDVNLLHSAVYRQHVSLGGKPKWKDKYEICATLMYGLIKDHPFHDANKRTAFLSSLYYLYCKGRILSVDKKIVEGFAVDVADNRLSKYARYNDYKKKFADPEVMMISHFLKKNTRQMDKRYYVVTYRELNKILKNFDCYLDNPSGNYIDLVKKETRNIGLFRKRTKEIHNRVRRIGFPGLTKQVSKKDLNTVRREAGLIPENGVDSQTFYKGVEPLHTLISEYQDALINLADR